MINAAPVMATTHEQLLRVLEFANQPHVQLRISQLRFLLTIKIHPDRSLSELAEMTGMTLSAISRAIDVWGSKKSNRARDLSLGYLETKRSEFDDRVITVRLTPKGHHYLDSIIEQLNIT